jgi:hypothetical protein
MSSQGLETAPSLASGEARRQHYQAAGDGFIDSDDQRPDRSISKINETCHPPRKV